MSYDKDMYPPNILTTNDIKQIGKRPEVTHVDYDQLPGVLKRKIKKYQEQQAKKHPHMTDQQMMDKIGKKFNINFEY